MSSGFDDRDDERYEDDRDDRRRGGRSPEGAIAAARAKVSTPGLLLLLSGLLGVVIMIAWLGVMFTAPTLMYDTFVDFIKNQPQSPEQQRQLKDMEAQKDQMRLDSPLNIASAAVGFVVNLLTVIGAFMMRSLKGYGLAMTGAIAGIVPMGGCCCLTLPFGIWALVVLVNADVKAGFKAARGESQSERY